MKTKAIFLSILLVTAAIPSAFAQAAVLDIANLLNAIDQLYATYDEITSMIEQVQNTYQQLQKQIEMVKGMNWDDVSMVMSDHNGIPDIRDPMNSVMKQVDHNMKLVTDVKDTLQKKKINFGGKSYTFGGLFGFGEGSNATTIFDLPKNIVDYVQETSEATTAGWEGKLTYKQKEAIMRRHGLSPRNYATVRLVEETSAELIKEMLTVGTGEHAEAVLKEAATNQAVITELMNEAGESMVAQQQAQTLALLNIAGGLAKLEAGANRGVAFMAHQEVDKKAKDELEARQREIEEMKKENERMKRSLVPNNL